MHGRALADLSNNAGGSTETAEAQRRRSGWSKALAASHQRISEVGIGSMNGERAWGVFGSGEVAMAACMRHDGGGRAMSVEEMGGGHDMGRLWPWEMVAHGDGMG